MAPLIKEHASEDLSLPHRAALTVGTDFGEFRLWHELGRGAKGRVFLAVQPSLGNRPVVLKIVPRTGHEHLSLARLQHTHIVPLFMVQDEPARGLRALCMPYFGHVTLKDIIAELANVPCRNREGRDVLTALDCLQASEDLELTRASSARKYLASASYVDAVCWIGSCLADALQYAHERGLVHLDLKPANVLLGADGQPMLLDFHIARAPLKNGDPWPTWMGGTPQYMSPEHCEAMCNLEKRERLVRDVDGRSDTYSLGKMLYELLAGSVETIADHSALRRLNPAVSVGLADLVHKCLALDPGKRYQQAGDLAADLRRHLGNKLLRGVPNRSLAERWRKWRRRSPYGLLLLLLVIALTAALGTAVAMTAVRVGEHRHLAEQALFDGQELLRQKRFAEAVEKLSRGLDFAGNDRLARALADHLHLAQRAEKAQELNRLAQAVRIWSKTGGAHKAEIVLEAGCQHVWNSRKTLLDRTGAALEEDLEQQIRGDLRDVADGLARLLVRLAEPEELADRRRQAEAIRAEAATLRGSRPASPPQTHNFLDLLKP